ncbi:MAG: hypothetical protein K6E51_01035 [Treponema sp.]|nr:hypothetical protein [Treponema sp.]
MKIVIVDSSAVVRTILEQNLSNLSNMQILHSFSNCNKIIKQTLSDTPDAVICGVDVQDKSEHDALSFICNEMKIPVMLLVHTDAPLPFFTSLIDKMEKPGLNNYSSEFFTTLIEKLSILIKKNTKKTVIQDDLKTYKVLCIGSSTGGPTAVCTILSSLGSHFPLPILYTQHIEIDKDKPLVDWLNSVCENIKIKLAEDGEEAHPGVVYMAPADTHLIIRFIKSDGTPVLQLSDEPPEHYLRPAVNKLFKSAATQLKNNVLAVLLTGMGADGAAGCKEICDKGGWTIVEDKSTCAVFGMPAAAIEAGGAKEVLPRTEIAKRIIELVKTHGK